MEKPKKLSSVGVLALTLALFAFAEGATPPCASPEPGQTETPPCATQLTADNSNTPGVTSIGPGDTDMRAVSHPTSLTRIAADLLLEFLPLF